MRRIDQIGGQHILEALITKREFHRLQKFRHAKLRLLEAIAASHVPALHRERFSVALSQSAARTLIAEIRAAVAREIDHRSRRVAVLVPAPFAARPETAQRSARREIAPRVMPHGPGAGAVEVVFRSQNRIIRARISVASNFRRETEFQQPQAFAVQRTNQHAVRDVLRAVRVRTIVARAVGLVVILRAVEGPDPILKTVAPPSAVKLRAHVAAVAHDADERSLHEIKLRSAAQTFFAKRRQELSNLKIMVPVKVARILAVVVKINECILQNTRGRTQSVVQILQRQKIAKTRRRAIVVVDLRRDIIVLLENRVTDGLIVRHQRISTGLARRVKHDVRRDIPAGLVREVELRAFNQKRRIMTRFIGVQDAYGRILEQALVVALILREPDLHQPADDQFSRPRGFDASVVFLLRHHRIDLAHVRARLGDGQLALQSFQFFLDGIDFFFLVAGQWRFDRRRDSSLPAK